MQHCPAPCTLALPRQAISQAGASVAQPSTVGVAVGIASAEYNNHLVARFTAGVSAYSATGGALS